MVEKYLSSLLLKRYQSGKSFEIGLGYLIYVKIFVESCFLRGHLYKEP